MASNRSFLGNILVQWGGKVASMAVGLATVILLSRALGPEGYGEYTTAITFLQLFGVVVDLGLTLTLVVMISEAGADEEKAVGGVLALRLVSAAFLFALAPLAVIPFPYTGTVKLAVAIGAGAYFLMSGATLLTGIFQRHAVLWRAALAEVVNRAVLLGLVIAFVALDLGVVAMVGAMLASNLAWLAMTVWLARPFVRIRPRLDWTLWKKTLSRSWPIGVSIIFNLIYLKGDILFLASYREEAEVGLYGFAYRVIDVLTAFPTIFMGLLLPSLVREWSHGGRDRFRAHMRNAAEAFAIVAFPIATGTQVIGPDLAALIGGEAYRDAGDVLRVLILALVGVFFGSLYGHAVVAVERQRQMILGYASVAAFSIAGYLIFIPSHGMWGAAWVTLASEAAIALVTYLAVRREAGDIFPGLATPAKALACSLLMAVLIALLPGWHVVPVILIGIGAYAAMMLLMRGVRPELARELLGIGSGGPHRH